MYESSVALVLWEPDYIELELRLKAACNMQCTDIFTKIGRLETPDEAYVCLYASQIEWHSDKKEIGEIEMFIRLLRHSFIRIGEDFGDIEKIVRVEDARGCDEEFEYLVDIDTQMTGLEFFEGLEDFGISETGEITSAQIKQAEYILTDNGVKADEAQTILRALGFVLLDKDLYPES